MAKRTAGKGVFLVNCLAIIPKDGKILIGKRHSDQFIPSLTWCFPGGRPTYNKTLEDSLANEVKKKTGLRIRVIKLIHARIYPEKPSFLSLYYLAEPVEGKEKAGEKFVEIKWIEPTDVTKYMKVPPIDHKILEFLKEQEG